jgi:phosphopantetheinyl transferase (holo-ACP synthase)
MRSSTLDPLQSAVRVWSIKEAVAKILNITLAEAWQRTEVARIGGENSLLRIDAGPELQAGHHGVDGHIVTWLLVDS